MESFLLTEAELRARAGGKWKKYGPDVIPAFVADMISKLRRQSRMRSRD